VSTAPSFPLDLHASPFHAEEFIARQFDPSRSLSPAERLCWALLEDCFVFKRFALRHPQYVSALKQVARDLAWLNGAEAPILFADVCDALHLDPDRVRQRYFGLQNGRARHRAATFG
jgi:hypothetical protein